MLSNFEASLAKRLLTAVVGIPLVVGTCLFLPNAFKAIVVVAIVIGLVEFYNLDSHEVGKSMTLAGIGAGLTLALSTWAFGETSLPIALTVSILTLTLLCLFQKRKGAFLALSITFAGVLYVAWLFSHVILLRDMTHGADYVLLLLTILWLGDTGAYFVGISFGKHPLWPSVSPKKTIEGSLGGLLFSLLAVLIFKEIQLYCQGLGLSSPLPGLSYTHYIFLGIGLALLSQGGDLCQSLLKRDVGIKDSGHILPGHGGILDRCDGLLFAAPALYYWTRHLL